MSRRRWQALRTLRVVLACLVLWLPARVASASYGPADAVVMIAAARGAEGAMGAGSSGSRAENGRQAQRASIAPSSPDATPLAGASRREPPSGAPRTTNRADPPPRYLLNCALLR